MKNVNTKQYWDNRFVKDDENSWSKYNGEHQTLIFATEISKRLRLPRDFDGKLLDYGCALGDAIPVYRSAYPKAKIIGMDSSAEAIEICKKKFGHISKFISGNIDDVPFVDVIVVSNVLEHISDDMYVVNKLLKKCSYLYISVPYAETLDHTKVGEHVNSYDEFSFNEFNAQNEIFLCRGVGLIEKLRSFFNIEIKNILRPFFGKQKYFGGVYLQILFYLENEKK